MSLLALRPDAYARLALETRSRLYRHREPLGVRWIGLVVTGLVSTFLALCFLSLAANLRADTAREEKTIEARRIVGVAPVLDGVLDDSIWQEAPIVDDFLMKDPTEHQGKAPSERTTIQVAYDDDAIYVAVMCCDSDPAKIVTGLSRRDGDVESDWVAVFLDSHHDHQNSTFFAVNASGTLTDGIEVEGRSGEPDKTWNGVWEARVNRNHDGWCVEYRIPYHVLRFSEKPEYVWGFQAIRNISRKKERVDWALVKTGESGWVSRFGHLVGLRDIHPSRHVEIVPFLRARSVQASAASTRLGETLGAALGGDVRVGLSSNISLNATLNPDFGQVEADPAVLNLTVFETFFEERRPFFIEGNALFSAPNPDIVGIEGTYRLFYSRRIGRAPGYFGLPDGYDEVKRPDATTILGAAKLSGKTARRTSFAALDAVTQSEFAVVETNGIGGGERRDVRVEPFANYFVGKAQQDIGERGNVGLTMTTVNRTGAPPAATAGLDSTWRWKKNAYSLYGSVAASRTGTIDDRRDGATGQAYFGKFSGWFGGQLFADVVSRDFDVSDLGFMGRSNLLRFGAHVYANRQTPWLLARRSGYNINVWRAQNLDGVVVKKGINLNNWNQTRFYGFAGWGLSREMPVSDDLATRGGPLMRQPGVWWGWFNLGSDWSKPVSAFCHASWNQADDGAGYRRQIGGDINLRPAANAQLSFGPGYSFEKNNAQWIKNLDSDGDGTDDRFLFGELRSRTLNFSARLSVSFTPNLSAQAYAQPFVAVGDFGRIKELARAESYEFRPYDGALDDDPDFHERSLRGNVVLRWEYQPGSALFLVWSQSRRASLDDVDETLGSYSELRNAFGDEGQNVFLVKWDYWLGM